MWIPKWHIFRKNYLMLPSGWFYTWIAMSIIQNEETEIFYCLLLLYIKEFYCLFINYSETFFVRRLQPWFSMSSIISFDIVPVISKFSGSVTSFSIFMLDMVLSITETTTKTNSSRKIYGFVQLVGCVCSSIPVVYIILTTKRKIILEYFLFTQYLYKFNLRSPLHEFALGTLRAKEVQKKIEY